MRQDEIRAILEKLRAWEEESKDKAVEAYAMYEEENDESYLFDTRGYEERAYSYRQAIGLIEEIM